MSWIGRLGIISIIFGGIGFLTCWLFSILPFLSLPFSIAGLGFATIATVSGFVKNERWYGFWLPVLGLVLSAIGLAVATKNYNDYLARQKQEEIKNSPAMKLVGVWEKENEQPPMFLNFTENGNVVFTTMIESKAVNQSDHVVDRLARYDVERAVLSVQQNRRESESKCDFQFQLINENRLILDRISIDCEYFLLTGTWRLVSSETTDEPVVADEQLAEYQRKLDELKSDQARFEKSLTIFNSEREKILSNLKSYEVSNRERDEAWEIHARDLKILVDQIEVIQRRLPRLEAAIIRLESAISNRIRQTQMDRLGLSDEQLSKLLRITIEIDDALESKADMGPIAELELQEIINQQMNQDQENIDDADDSSDENNSQN